MLVSLGILSFTTIVLGSSDPCNVSPISQYHEDWYGNNCQNGLRFSDSPNDFENFAQHEFAYHSVRNTSGEDLYYEIRVVNRREININVKKIHLNPGVLLLRRSEVIPAHSTRAFSFLRKPAHYLNVTILMTSEGRNIYCRLRHTDVKIVELSANEEDQVTRQTLVTTYAKGEGEDENLIIIDRDAAQYAIQQYTFIATSDPQPWRVNGVCGDPNSDRYCWINNAGEKMTRASIRWGAAGAVFVVANGDLTEYGRTTTYNDYKVYYGNSNFLGSLGNHDYQNNVNDCTEFPDSSYNACARNMVRYVIADTKWRVDQFGNSWFDCTGCNTNYPDGSMSWGFDYGNFHIMNFNNYPSYKVTLDHWSTPNINIYEGWDKLLEKGKDAVNNRGQKLIIFYHQPVKSDRMRELYDAIGTTNVLFIHGHTHELTAPSREADGSVSVNSGAMFFGDYIRIDVDGNCLTLTGFSEVLHEKFSDRRCM